MNMAPKSSFMDGIRSEIKAEKKVSGTRVKVCLVVENLVPPTFKFIISPGASVQFVFVEPIASMAFRLNDGSRFVLSGDDLDDEIVEAVVLALDTRGAGVGVSMIVFYTCRFLSSVKVSGICGNFSMRIGIVQQLLLSRAR